MYDNTRARTDNITAFLGRVWWCNFSGKQGKGMHSSLGFTPRGLTAVWLMTWGSAQKSNYFVNVNTKWGLVSITTRHFHSWTRQSSGESLQGWTWHIYRQGSAEYFGGFEFRESVFFWVLITAAVFLGLLNKSCILKCFISSTVLFRSTFIHEVLQSWVSIIIISCLTFEKWIVFLRVFLRVLLFGKYFFWFFC